VVEAGAVVDGVVLFDGAHIGAGASVHRSAIGRHAEVGANTTLRDVVIGDRARVGANNELIGGARVWPDMVLADGAVRFSADE
jgi:mannose-1-phosphate guanylyltransferase